MPHRIESCEDSVHGEEGVGRKRELYEPEGHGSSQEALGGFTFLQCVCQLAWLEVWEGDRETYP